MNVSRKTVVGTCIFPLLILCSILFSNAVPVKAEDRPSHPPVDKELESGKGRWNFSSRDPFRPPAEFEEAESETIDTKQPSSNDSEKKSYLSEAALKPRIAIIIDDMGNRRHIDEQLLDLDLNFTFAFLPYAPFTREMAEKAWTAGYDILVHMPMEPKDPQWDPGPDALHVQDSFRQMFLTVEKNLALVPHATGVNNHMGSLFTEDRLAMNRFLEIIRQKGLFYIDSCTSADSVGMEEARKMGIRTARRDVFLDNIHTQEDIQRQLNELVRIARKMGWAVGIGHSCEATLIALSNFREEYLGKVYLVGVHEIIK